MTWMTVEAAVAIASDVLAGSIALVGFGLDSGIEFFAAVVVVWQLRGGGEERETRAVRLIGVTFFVLAAYLAAESIGDLVSGARAEQPIAGIAVTAAALIVMPSLALAKQRTGKALGNRTLIVDAAESALCAFTSGAALLGVGLPGSAGGGLTRPQPWPLPRSPSKTAWKSGRTTRQPPGARIWPIDQHLGFCRRPGGERSPLGPGPSCLRSPNSAHRRPAMMARNGSFDGTPGPKGPDARPATCRLWDKAYLAAGRLG